VVGGGGGGWGGGGLQYVCDNTFVTMHILHKNLNE
jgi:hypothetical protein